MLTAITWTPVDQFLDTTMKHILSAEDIARSSVKLRLYQLLVKCLSSHRVALIEWALRTLTLIMPLIRSHSPADISECFWILRLRAACLLLFEVKFSPSKSICVFRNASQVFLESSCVRFKVLSNRFRILQIWKLILLLCFPPVSWFQTYQRLCLYSEHFLELSIILWTLFLKILM